MIQAQLALIRRELWEHRAIYVAPLVIALVVALFTVLGQVTVSGHEHADKALDIGIIGVTNLSEQKRAAIISGAMVSVSVPLVFTMWILTIFYSLDCLHAERKDRSILFWRSIPTTDFETVLSKLLTALFVIPLITFGVIVITHLVVLLISSVWLSVRGANVWHLIWTAAPFFDNWSATLVFILALPLWLSPFVGWFLLVSAYTKRSPFLVAFLPIAVLPLLEGILFDSSVLAEAFFVRSFRMPLFPGLDNFYSVFQQGQHLELVEGASLSLWSLLDLGRFMTSPDLWLGIIVCGLFTGGAIYVRRYKDDS